MYVNEDFQLEYFVHWDWMCDFSVPLIFLSSVFQDKLLFQGNLPEMQQIPNVIYFFAYIEWK